MASSTHANTDAGEIIRIDGCDTTYLYGQEMQGDSKSRRHLGGLVADWRRLAN